MPILDLSRFCENGTVVFRLAKTIEYNETTGTIRVVAHSKITDSDQQAVLYIVVVLLFYSCGIIIGIVMYLKRERAEMEEERAYEDYLAFRADPARMARHFCKQQYTTRLKQMEENKRLRDLDTKRTEHEKQKLSKKRHSHGGFHFLSSRNTSPVGSPSTSRMAKPSPQIVIDNFDDIMAKRMKREDSRGSGDGSRRDLEIPTLVVQQDDLKACGLAASMPALNRRESHKSTLKVTEL